MSKITEEEALKCLGKVMDDTCRMEDLGEPLQVIKRYMIQNKKPTLEDVVKAWEDAMGECEVTFNIDEIKVIMPNLTKYLIKIDQVYSDRKVYHMNKAILNAINITIRYLEAQEGKS